MTPLQLSCMHAAAGGALIGLAAGGLLLMNGKVAGISGIVGGAVWGARGDRSFRLAFIAGLLTGGALFALRAPGLLPPSIPRVPAVIIIAGLLVGYGTSLSHGCTSGHGVCGIGRLAPRSMVATAVFVLVGMGATFVCTRILGWAT